MKRVAVVSVLLISVISIPAGAPAARVAQDVDTVQLFAFEIDPGCSTPDCLAPEDGAFYPGRATKNGAQFSGEPLEVPEGADVEFTNLSSEHHNIVSFKRIGRRPAFATGEHVMQGQSSTMTTRFLRPGVYAYFCGHHPITMFGLIEVVRQAE